MVCLSYHCVLQTMKQLKNFSENPWTVCSQETWSLCLEIWVKRFEREKNSEKGTGIGISKIQSQSAYLKPQTKYFTELYVSPNFTSQFCGGFCVYMKTLLQICYNKLVRFIIALAKWVQGLNCLRVLSAQKPRNVAEQHPLSPFVATHFTITDQEVESLSLAGC